MAEDPKQYNNLADAPGHQRMVAEFKQKLAVKMAAVRKNDLGLEYVP